ncbi:hypothetical protein GJ496_001271 [Pomphorhynchus laevis]|nr:hypothetical protein GJ496_001271 [Pomphorhynchus laevis]
MLVVSMPFDLKSLNKQLEEFTNREFIDKQRQSADDTIFDGIWSAFITIYDDIPDDYDCKQNFQKNVYDVLLHNIEYQEGQHTYKLAINRYSYMDYSAMNKLLNGFKQAAVKLNSIDWRDKKIVTPVKDQGVCGSCYTFSATGALEGMYALRNKALINLSEQQLIDCSADFGNAGCNGGLMEDCFEYIRDANGIQNENDYPYVGRENQCAHNNSVGAAVTCDSFVRIKEGDEIALMNAVARNGPISIAMDCSSPQFMSYGKGIYMDTACSPSNLNHAMLLVGYGTQTIKNKKQPYWIVKNSWGTSWGEKGYCRVARLHKNMCGIASYALYPVIEE